MMVLLAKGEGETRESMGTKEKKKKKPGTRNCAPSKLREQKEEDGQDQSCRVKRSKKKKKAKKVKIE